jgi:SAM-dependent methyltransferase
MEFRDSFSPPNLGRRLTYQNELMQVRMVQDGHVSPNSKEVEFYLRFHADRYRVTHRLVRNFLMSGDKKQILDIGASPYFATMLLREPGLEYCGITGAYSLDGRGQDLNRYDVCTEYRRQRFTLPMIGGCNIERTPLPVEDASVDIVLFLEVIEHFIHSSVHVLHEVARVLKPGGVLILTTDNAIRMVQILKMLIGQNIYWPYCRTAFGDRHNREYLAWEISDLLRGIGYTDVVVRLQNMQTFDPGINPLRYLAVFMCNAISSLPGFRKHRRHIFSCARKGGCTLYEPDWLLTPRLSL